MLKKLNGVHMSEIENKITDVLLRNGVEVKLNVILLNS